MVKHVATVTNPGRSGVADWLIQRVSALIMTAYLVFITVYLFMHPALDYATWHALFACSLVKIFSLLCLLALLGHVWIGLWTILTDYIKCRVSRGSLQILIILALLALLAWGIQTLWNL